MPVTECADAFLCCPQKGGGGGGGGGGGVVEEEEVVEEKAFLGRYRDSHPLCCAHKYNWYYDP